MPKKSKDQYLFKAHFTCRPSTWITDTTVCLRFLMSSKNGSAAWRQAERIARSRPLLRNPQMVSVKLVGKIDRIVEVKNA